MKLRGTLRQEHFGGPVWVLAAEDGAQYQLEGAVPAGLSGRRVEVEAIPAELDMGFSMVGEVVEVRAIRPL